VIKSRVVRKQVSNLASEISGFIIPMLDGFWNIHIVMGATKVGNTAEVVVSEIAVPQLEMSLDFTTTIDYQPVL